MNCIQKIAEQIIEHPDNAWAKHKSYLPVFAASEASEIVIIGQAPGIKAQESMIPWNDQSGKRLRKWLNIDSEDFYNPDKIALIPMDFYYPGKGKSGDLPPRKNFASKWHPKLFQCMKNIKLIVLVGQYAQSKYLSKTKKENLTKTVKSYNEYLPKYFPLPHPSPRNGIWLHNNPWFEKEIVPRLQEQVSEIIKQQP